MHKDSDNSQCSTRRSDLTIMDASEIIWRNRKNRD